MSNDMRRRLHFCQDIEGAIRNWKAREWKNIAKENGCSVEEAKSAFFEYLRRGWRVIPIGEPCEGFSYQTGCPGHVVAEALAEADSLNAEESK